MKKCLTMEHIWRWAAKPGGTGRSSWGGLENRTNVLFAVQRGSRRHRNLKWRLLSSSSSESETTTPLSEMVTRPKRHKRLGCEKKSQGNWHQVNCRDAACKSNDKCTIAKDVWGSYWGWSGRRPSWGRRAGRRFVLRPGCWERPCTPPPRRRCDPPMEASGRQQQREKWR